MFFTIFLFVQSVTAESDGFKGVAFINETTFVVNDDYYNIIQLFNTEIEPLTPRTIAGITGKSGNQDNSNGNMSTLTKPGR